MQKTDKYEDMYSYDEAVAYIEEHGVGCDPAADLEGEYVCDMLDDEYDAFVDEYDTYYEQSTLDSIIERAKKYVEEMKEEEEEE